MVVSNLGQLLNIVHVVAADIDIEHHRIAVVVLPLHQIFKVRPNRIERLWQRLSILHGIDGEINGRDARVAETIDHIVFHQETVRRQIDEDIFLRAVVNDLMNELRTQQRLAAHQRQYARTDRV